MRERGEGGGREERERKRKGRGEREGGRGREREGGREHCCMYKPTISINNNCTIILN